MQALYRWSAVVSIAGVVALASCSGSDDPDPAEPQPDPTGSILATVTGDGSGLAGATVRVYADGGTTALESGTTAANGQVAFDDLDTGAYDVEVVPPGGFELDAGEVARKDVTVAANQEAMVTFALAEIVVAPTEGDIQVHVVDGDADVPDVDVNLFEEGGSTALETLTTDGNGIVLFEDLTPGTYDVEIVLPEGYALAPEETARKSAEVTAGETAEVDFGVDGPDVVEVTAAGLSFSPAEVTIAPGTTVRWVLGGGVHTVTPTGNAEWTPATLDSSNEVFEHTFDATGTFDYQCDFHVASGMVGTITVE